jgi:hypothetical protein
MTYSEDKPQLDPFNGAERVVIPYYHCVYLDVGTPTKAGEEVIIAALQTYRLCTQAELENDGLKIYIIQNGRFTVDNTLAVNFNRDVLYGKIKREILNRGRARILVSKELFVDNSLAYLDESHQPAEVARQITLRLSDTISFIVFSFESWEVETVGLAKIFPDLVNLELIFDDL